jgi:hypothetical protein
MRPRPAKAPPVEPVPDVRIWCGIDPGATAGLVALAVPNVGPGAYDIDRARFVGSASVTATSSKAYTNAGARGTLLLRVRAKLLEWRVTDVVLEEPSEVPRMQWTAADGQKVTGQATGTVFLQGAHFGLCLGACVSLPWPVRVWAYPPGTPKRQQRKERDTGDPVLGWMQGRGRMPARELTLARCGDLLRQVKARPADGRIPTAAELTREHSEHERMAAGVLNYHLARERGRV